MSLKSLKNIKNLSDKKVLVRVDFNVPLKNNKVSENSRLLASLPTIKYLIENNSKVILVTHIGRPDGKIISSLKVDPVIKELSKLLNKKIKKLDFKNWQKLIKETGKIKSGEVAMLENIRFSPDEEKDTGNLAKDLSKLADIFVLDGFAVAHRPAASVSGVAKFLPSYVGLLLEKEIIGLDKVIKKPKKPFVVVLGGVKIETKLPVLKNLLPKTNKILIGGGLFNTYLFAKGYKIGDSLVDKDYKKEALKYCVNKKIVRPVDVVVGSMDGKKYRLVNIEKKSNVICKKGEAILDIGPATILLYSKYIKSAKTLVWNGAMGYFEQKPYDNGTLSIARLVAFRAKGEAYGVIGGGETLEAMKKVDLMEYIDLVSTGGGAMLEYLAGKKLPGIEALR